MLLSLRGSIPVFGGIYWAMVVVANELGCGEPIFQGRVFDPQELYCTINRVSFDLAQLWMLVSCRHRLKCRLDRQCPWIQ